MPDFPLSEPFESGTGIKLQIRISRGYFEYAPTAGMLQTSRRHKPWAAIVSWHFANKIEVAVVLKQQRDRDAQSAGLTKISYMADHGSKPTQKSHVLVDQDGLIGMDLEFMIGDGTSGFSGEVEVGVVGEIEGRRPVRNSLGFNDENIIAGDRIDDGDIHGARVALFAVRGAVCEA
jgi:hypothetical protein